jgi:hypothetical protein
VVSGGLVKKIMGKMEEPPSSDEQATTQDAVQTDEASLAASRIKVWFFFLIQVQNDSIALLLACVV